MRKPFVLLVTLAIGLLGSCSDETGTPDENEGGAAEAGDGGTSHIGGAPAEALGGSPSPGGSSGDMGGETVGGSAGGGGETTIGGAPPGGGEPPIDESGGQAGIGGAGGEPSGTGGVGNTPTVRLTTFNIQNFGPTKLTRPEVMAELVEIVRRYPFVAVQEISDVNQQVPGAFLEMINSNGASYEMLLSPRSGQQPDDKTYQEQYAFYYDASVMEPLSPGQLYDDSAQDYFVREPYVAQFEVIDGGFTFVAITVHTQPDNAVAEIGHLEGVVAWAQDQYPSEDDFIILGDLNAGCSYASPAELDLLGLRSSDHVWLVPDTADTNLAMSACAYDRIIVTSTTQTNYYGEWGVDSSFTNTMVSDHWPVWAEFWAVERR
ncbi:MAG TPA: endonuclease/exonuclease/phosphatase family protein [Polyangiaceae bacterium]|nr:endonuclease/exonuclease/phosphatase family protein [Polyangiaceae bacterium]